MLCMEKLGYIKAFLYRKNCSIFPFNLHLEMVCCKERQKTGFVEMGPSEGSE